MLPDLRDNLKDFSAVHWLSIMTSQSSRTGLPVLLIYAKFKHSKQLIYLSQSDFLMLHDNSLMSGKSSFHHQNLSSTEVKKSIVLTFFM